MKKLMLASLREAIALVTIAVVDALASWIRSKCKTRNKRSK